MAPKVLFVLTSASKLDKHDKPTGWYLPELAHPYYKLAPVADIVVASPAGGEAPLDPGSVEAFKEDEESSKFLKEKSSVWKNTEKLSSFLGKSGEFAAIFYVGGHGPMFDLANDSTSHALIREFYESNKIVSAVCHGPAALANVKLNDGTFLIADKAVTGFSNVEEDQAQMTAFMPFMLETALNTNSNGKYEKATDAWAPKVIVSGNIITGQNPASAAPIGEAIAKAIST